jgi:hypothetical protein
MVGVRRLWRRCILNLVCCEDEWDAVMGGNSAFLLSYISNLKLRIVVI